MDNFRLEEVLVRDKFANLGVVAKMLEKEITPIIKNYLLLSDDVVVRYKKTGETFTFNIEVKAERVKEFGVVVV